MAVVETREVHEAGWLERMGSSIKGVVTGVVFIAAAGALLFWNEGRAVKTARRLAEGAGAVVRVPSDKVDAANEGKLVHVSGRAETKETLADPQFGVSATAIKLTRSVEIYQWVEEKDVKREKQGDKTIEKTTYTYKKAWCASPIDSSKFKEAGHENPQTTAAFSDQTLYAKDVTLGAFKLSDTNIKGIGGAKPFAFPQDFKLPEALKGASFVNGVIYVPGAPAAATTSQEATAKGVSPLAAAAQAAGQAVANAVTPRDVAAAPQVGDLRVTFKFVEPHNISLCQMQKGNSFAPWPASDGKTISLQREGLMEAAEMFADAQSANSKLTWFLRVLGFILMFAGFKMVFGPLSTLVDVIPILRNIVGIGLGLVSFLLALAGTLLTAGIAWIVYRPVLGITLIAVAVGCIVLVFLKKAKAVPAK